jgi:hypothetical protein
MKKTHKQPDLFLDKETEVAVPNKKTSKKPRKHRVKHTQPDLWTGENSTLFYVNEEHINVSQKEKARRVQAQEEHI